MDEIRHEHCIPCRGDEPRLNDAEIDELKPQVPEWEVVEDEGVKKLRRRFKTGDYHLPPQLVNHLKEVADAEDHHPVIEYEPGHIVIDWWTHSIKGLHRNDFIMAAKTDEIFEKAKNESGM
jgi:4a-hydroxytetrahydrobiopterin dehydratase